ncbi:MAG TPA: heme exporter protein CcmD [Gallionella sp.]|nr:heme exporter protein CcmD [Gallionella sp.]
MNWADFFNMGGYAFYVWGAYGVSLSVFIIEVLMVRHKRTVTLRQVRLLNRAGE